MQHLIRATKTEITRLHLNWDWQNHYRYNFLFSGRNWDPWINSQVWLICIKWMKLIDLEMLRIANQSKEGHPRGCPWGCGEEGPPIVLGPYVSQSLTLGGPCLRTRAWVRMLGHGLGCSIWESQAFKLRVTRSASMLRSINEWPSENGEGGWREEVRKMKERRGRGEWQRENCKALREWRLRPVSPR